MKLPAGSFAHLDRLTDGTGIFEHAEGVSARTDGGYCLDDAARALVVVCRESAARQAGAAQDAGDGDDSSDGDDGAVVARIGEIYLSFVLAAQAGDGRFHNRLSRDGRWEDTANVEDCWGRALWGLGTFLATPLSAASRDLALQAFTLGARWRSRWRRSMALAALGAAEVLTVLPDHHGARSLLAAAARGKAVDARADLYAVGVVAVARGSARLRERGAARGPHRRGCRSQRRVTARRRPATPRVAPRNRDER